MTTYMFTRREQPAVPSAPVLVDVTRSDKASVTCTVQVYADGSHAIVDGKAWLMSAAQSAHGKRNVSRELLSARLNGAATL